MDRWGLPILDDLQRVAADGSGWDLSQPIQSNVQTWVVVHGRQSSASNFYDLAAAIDGFKSGDQVLVLDWQEGAADNHLLYALLDGARWIPEVASWAGEALRSVLSINASQV